MKPSQRISVACRQTGEGARRLGDWLEANRSVLGLAHAAVTAEIAELAAGLPAIAAAADAPPAVAVVGTAGAGKLDLVLHCVAAHGRTTPGDLGARPFDVATLRRILPADDGEGGSAIVRFTTAETPPTPKGYPVRLGLLSEADVVAVLVAGHLTAPGRRAPLTTDVIEATLEQLSAAAGMQTVAGLSERDVVDLAAALEADWAGHPDFAVLRATRFFDRLREVVGHVPATERRAALAVLWGGDSGATALLERLGATLDRLGHGTEAYAPADALVLKDRTSFAHHPDSILDAATIRRMAPTPGQMITVMNRYGQALEVERACLAAVTGELPLVIGPSRLSGLAPAELLDIPVAPRVSEIAMATAGDADTFTRAVARYARHKALHLLPRATRRHDVTAVVLVVVPDGQDDTLAPGLTGWIDAVQGPTPAVREHVPCGLITVAVAAPDADLWTDRQARAGAAEQVAASVREVSVTGGMWADAWTPGRPLPEVAWIARLPEHATAGPSGASLGSPGLGSPGLGSPGLATPTGGHPGLAGRSGPAVDSGGAVQPTPAARIQEQALDALMARLAELANLRIKHLHLTRAVTALRRRLRASVARHRRVSDPMGAAEWRRSTAIVIANRLQRAGDHRRLGHLQRAIVPPAAEIAAVVETQLAQERRRRPAEDEALAVGEDDGPAARAAAATVAASEAVVAHWLTAMRRLARSDRRSRELAVEPTVLQHLVDELQDGVLRLDLAAEIASAGQDERAVVDPARLAAIAVRILAAYVEVLGDVRHGQPSGGAGRTGAAVRVRSGEVVVAETGDSGYGSRRARAGVGTGLIGDVAARRWEQAFTALVEDNITAAQGTTARGDRDRELGELLQLFASGPFEVDV